MDKVDVGLLADAHAEWFAEAMRWVYRQAFIQIGRASWRERV